MHPFRRKRRLDRHRLNGANELAGDSCIDALTRETHTARHAKHLVRAHALVDGIRIAPPVGHLQTAAASGTGHEPNQQRSSAATRLRAALSAICIDGKLLLVALVLRPVDVALMMVF